MKIMENRTEEKFKNEKLKNEVRTVVTELEEK